VTCTSEDVVAHDLRPLVTTPIRLTADADSVSISKASVEDLMQADRGAVAGRQVVKASRAPRESPLRVSTGTIIPLSMAQVATAGAKAAACGQLAAMAAKGAPFKAPFGAVLPFGCLEAAVKAAHATVEFTTLLHALETEPVGPSLDQACWDMQELVLTRCQPQYDLVDALQKELGSAGVVIARSSANVEDLEGLSGAGLYESVPNLDAKDAGSLANGVARVWLSLFSRRAVLSRRAAGIAQTDACMAVLVQVSLRHPCCAHGVLLRCLSLSQLPLSTLPVFLRKLHSPSLGVAMAFTPAP
jgi:phosphoglucan, water dikinase